MKFSFLLAIASGAILSLQPVVAHAGQPLQSKESITQRVQLSPIEKHTKVTYDTYILGPGDSIQIEVLDLPDLSGSFSIGPDGTIYIPRLRGLYVEGLTVDELKYFITEQLKEFVIEPKVFITPRIYRSVRVYVGGEVARPGYYTINDRQVSDDLYTTQSSSDYSNSGSNRTLLSLGSSRTSGNTTVSTATLFDALQAARGVTPFSQLSKVEITRRRPQSQGGGKIRAQVNFLRLISDGDDKVNIRLYDNDTIFVHKSEDVLRDQLMAASRTNLSPDFVEVFVSGRVKEPGPQQLPQGASLNQAIASAGGPKILRGKVEFLRFNREGSTDRRVFNYNPNASSGDNHNPVLMPGDVVRVNESIASASLEFLNEITAPAVGVYSVYSIYQDFQ